MLGSLLSDRYRILSKLGEGGMGEVYLAEHVNLGRKEALKILHPALAQDPDFISRFRREARATNRVQHPNIVSVYDFGQLVDGRFYLSMEYADGQRLDHLLREKGQLPLGRVLDILHQLAEAVEHAHQLGVVHCDLKPENLILIEHRRRPDVLKVLDFGIAKMSVHEREDQGTATRKGQVFGTPHYMAPEQVGNEPIDGRTDLYAIGCIAFELAVGHTVFSGRTVEVISSHLLSPVDPPSQRASGSPLPPEFDALVLRCLQKKPEDRFQDGRELRQAIERIPGFAHGRTASPKRRFGSHLRLPTFETEDTDNTSSAVIRPIHSEPFDDPAGIASSPTLGVDGDELRLAQREALLDVMEGLLDIGHDDVQLLIGATRLRELGDEMSRSLHESSQLETRTAELEQTARERESSLRFALGEMVFARAQAQSAGQPPPADLEQQIALIERRLARLSQDLERNLAQLTERAIVLAAARADIEEQMTAECAPLERRIEEVLPRYEHSPAIRPAAVAWRTLRALRPAP